MQFVPATFAAMSESDTGSVTTGHRDDVTDLETFVQKLIQRLSQYVVQSRQGMLTKAKSDPNATRQVWFSVAVKVRLLNRICFNRRVLVSYHFFSMHPVM